MRLGILGSLIVWASVSAALAQETVREFSWTELKKAGQLTVGEIEPGGPMGKSEQLKIDNPTDEPKTVTVFDINRPGVTTLHYALDGSVRYQDVKGKGYLEIWNWFSDGSMCFTRTLGDSGPMQVLEGSSSWRPFVLPFFSNEKGGTPTRIVFNVVFAGRGTVYLDSVKLLQYSTPTQLQDSVAWWTAQTAGWIVGIGGCIWAALLTVSLVLYRAGKARCFVLSTYAVLFLLGVGSLAIGLIAQMLGQPYVVCGTLMQGGFVFAAVCGAGFPTLRRRYQQIELRKMTAMDSR